MQIVDSFCLCATILVQIVAKYKGRQIMPVISNNMAKAIKRQRGELNLKVSDLAEQTNLSRFTLYRVLNGTGEYVTDKTYNALNEWLYQKL